MSTTKMLFLAALTIATVSCRSFEKRSAEADANPGFDQTFLNGSFSQSYDCSGPAGCGGARAPPSTINQQFNQGSSNPFDNGFFNQFQQWRKRRSAEADAEPGFKQTFHGGSHSQSFDCTGPNGCGANVGGFQFNTQNVQNHANSFHQSYNGGSSAVNIDHKKKRSAEADAKPGFKQTYESGSISQSYDCSGPNGCGEGVGRVTYNTQNVRNIADSFRQQYNGGSSAVNIDNGKKKRSAEPGFQQTYSAGSHYQNYDSTGATTGMNTYLGGGQSMPYSDAQNNGNQPSTSTNNQANGNYPSNHNQSNGNYPSNHNQANGNYPSNHNQANGNYPSNHNQANGNYPSNHNQANGNNPSNHNQATGNAGSGFDQTYMPGSHFENIDSTGATTGIQTVVGGADNSGAQNNGNQPSTSTNNQSNGNYPSNHDQANGNYPSNYNQAN